MNPLQQLHAAGQSVWLDYIRRHLLTSGELGRLIEQDALTGMTSNPTLFDKAIAGSSDYDEALRSVLSSAPRSSALELYEQLAFEDIRMAADALRPVYERTGGADGFVSLEAPPNLAHDTRATVSEARRLFAAVGRPNVMIKVPATPEGIPATEALIAEGINVNITLMFSMKQYEAVARAYLRGIARARQPERVSSVASFFVSRVDTKVDRALDSVGTPEALALRGRIAIANAKLVYRRFRELFQGSSFAALAAKGARVQRPLWASTSTKNPTYPDVLYVEELIGTDTVDTMPPHTLEAFRDHGRVRPTLQEGLDEAEKRMGGLSRLGIDFDAITRELLSEGVDAFAASFEQMTQTLETRRGEIAIERTDRQLFSLGALQSAVTRRLDEWNRERVGRRIWSKDPTLWATARTPDIVNRLGWLTLRDTVQDCLEEVRALAREAQSEAVQSVVLLGMGGSSLAPEVFANTFGNAPGAPSLTVLDSTHPSAVLGVRERIDPRHTWFIVSSKSGTTLESLSFFRYFWDQASRSSTPAGRHFIAITDPGTPLESLARSRGFRRVFPGLPDVGGRYSALTVFGLVPAALAGADVDRLLDRAWTMAEACSFCVPEASNPALALGAALGELAAAGRDKVTFFTSPRLASFPEWLEQLIAESTGKEGKGIVPVADEPPGEPGAYGDDRVFVLIDIDGHPYAGARTLVERLASQGHPVIRMQISDAYDLGQEIFRWEFAVAAAGMVLRIHPFNQPDVQLAKDLAQSAMSSTGLREDIAEGVNAEDDEQLQRGVRDWLSQAKAGDYVALQAYLAPSDEVRAALAEIRAAIRDSVHLATTSGFGPRFLHSTGQLHKGGPSNGLFLQIVDDAQPDLQVPETDYSFGRVIRAQAIGDYDALVQRGRRVLRVRLGSQPERGLRALRAAVAMAVGLAGKP